jgi:hypothetical protein
MVWDTRLHLPALEKETNMSLPRKPEDRTYRSIMARRRNPRKGMTNPIFMDDPFQWHLNTTTYDYSPCCKAAVVKHSTGPGHPPSSTMRRCVFPGCNRVQNAPMSARKWKETKEALLKIEAGKKPKKNRPTTKKCRKCGEWKPLADFHKNPRIRDGRHSYCKPCRSVKATGPESHHEPQEEEGNSLQRKLEILADDLQKLSERASAMGVEVARIKEQLAL